MSGKYNTPFGEQGDERTDDQQLEAALRAAMQAEQPSERFAERVEARLASVETFRGDKGLLAFKKKGPVGRGVFDPSSVRMSLARAAVLLLAITLPLGLRLHHEAERARGEAAKEQVLLAFRITGSQLRSIQERTQSINAGRVPEGDSQ